MTLGIDNLPHQQSRYRAVFRGRHIALRTIPERSDIVWPGLCLGSGTGTKAVVGGRWRIVGKGGRKREGFGWTHKSGFDSRGLPGRHNQQSGCILGEYAHYSKRRYCPFAGYVAEEAGHVLQRLEDADFFRRSYRTRSRSSCGFLYELPCRYRSCSVCHVGLGRLRDDTPSRPHQVAERTRLGEETREHHEEVGR
jgi:hypothetical protein